MNVRLRKKLFAAFIAVLLVIAQFIPAAYAVEAGKDESTYTELDRVGKELMPPNPEGYPELYGNKQGNGKGGMRAAAQTVTPPRELAAGKEMIPEAGAVEKVLVIPFVFTNVDFSTGHDRSYYESIMDKMRDYYEKNSGYDGVKGITVNATVAQAVYSSHTMEFYGADYVDIDDKNGNIAEMAREAVSALDASGFDFTPFDRDGDGVIDHLMIVHAGAGQEEASGNSDCIWSHRGTIDNDGEAVDGKKAINYLIVPETGRLGVFAHEFGHDLGLPDLYDTDNGLNGETYGVGRWDIMGLGSWNHLPGEESGSTPANLSAYSKALLGWVTPIDVTENTSVNFTNTSGKSEVYCLWPKGDTEGKECYLIEYRRKIGFDSGLPGEGVLIWHLDIEWTAAAFDYNEVNAYNARLGLELEQADGRFDMWHGDNNGDEGDPFPGSTANRNFITVPYGMNYSNIDIEEFSFVEVRNIMVSGNNASADFVITPAPPSVVDSVYGPENNAIVDFQPYFGWGIATQAQEYLLQISEDSSFTKGLKEIRLRVGKDGIQYDGMNYTYLLPGSTKLDFARVYYWRVAGLNELSGDSRAWSQVRSFKILGDTSQIAAPAVTFSFDGPDAGKLKGITTLMEYSLNGGQTYTMASGNDITLSSSEIKSITSANDIKIRVAATDSYAAGDVQTIDVLPQPQAPQITADDSANTLSGINGTMEFSADSINWTRFNNNLPSLSGDVHMFIRVAATGVTPSGYMIALTFTNNAPVQSDPGGSPGGGGGTPGGGGGGFIPGPPVPVVQTPAPVEKAGVKLDESAIKEKLNDTKVSEITATIPQDAKEKTAVISASVFTALAEKEKKLTIESEKVAITLPPTAINSKDLKDAGSGAEVKFEVQSLDKDALKERLKTEGTNENKGLFAVGNSVFEFKSEIVTSAKTQPVTSFNAPVTISISLEGLNLSGVDTDKLGAYYFNESTKEWEYMGGVYDKKTKKITFTTGHFSLYTVMRYEKSFKDIENHWAKADIEKMAAKHIAKGKTEESFGPDATITRAEFTAILVRALGLKDKSGKKLPFNDVKGASWYSSEMSMAYNAGIVVKEDGTAFRPDADITREEMAIMIVRALKVKMKELQMNNEEIDEMLKGFSDKEDIWKAAKESIAIAVDKGIIKGRPDGTFAPRANATRAEAMVMIKRLLSKM